MVEIKPKTKVKFRVTGDGVSHARTDVSARDVGFTIDEPAERGGTSQGPSPTETAVSALIGCTNTISHKCAHALGIDIGNVDISAECELDRRGVILQEEIDVPFRSIEIDVLYDGRATQAEAERVAQETEKYCAVSKLFCAAGTQLTINWQRKAR